MGGVSRSALQTHTDHIIDSKGFMRYCPKCGIEKSLTDFYNRSGVRNKQARAWCKSCENAHSAAKQREARKVDPDRFRSYDLKKNFGITLEEKNAMAAAQNHRCAACGTTKPGGQYNKWATDHDHKTGKTRGLLCTSCNLTLGNANEDIHRLVTLTAYLVRHQSNMLVAV